MKLIKKIQWSLFPYSIFHIILLPNQLSFANTFVKSLYYQDCYFTGVVLLWAPSWSYFHSNNSPHLPFDSTPNLHIHLASKTLLNLPMSLTPNPPSYFLLQNCSQLIQVIFLPSLPQLHWKILCIFVSIWHAKIDTLKKDR